MPAAASHSLQGPRLQPRTQRHAGTACGTVAKIPRRAPPPSCTVYALSPAIEQDSSQLVDQRTPSALPQSALPWGSSVKSAQHKDKLRSSEVDDASSASSSCWAAPPLVHELRHVANGS